MKTFRAGSCASELGLSRALRTLEQKGLVENNAKVPQIPTLLTICCTMGDFRRTFDTQKDPKGAIFWAFGTKLGRQNATL